MEFYKIKDIKCPKCGSDILFGIATPTGGKTEDMISGDIVEVEIGSKIDLEGAYKARRRVLDLERINYYAHKVIKDDLPIDNVPERYREDVRQRVSEIIITNNLEGGHEEQEQTSDSETEGKKPFTEKVKIVTMSLLAVFALVSVVLYALILSNEADRIGINPTTMVEMLSSELVDETAQLVKSAVNTNDVTYTLSESFGEFSFIRARYELADNSILHARFYYSDYDEEWTLSEWYLELPARIGGDMQ